MDAEARVLVVDDDPDFLDLLTTQLKYIPNIKIYVAQNPRQALNMLVKDQYKLIVSDWALSTDTNASEVFTEADEKLQERDTPPPAKVPVMFMSGSEKVMQTRGLHGLKNFEPVSFILKRCGTQIIRGLAESLLARFYTPRRMQTCSA